MLREFIRVHGEEIIKRCRAKVSTRSVPPPSDAAIDHGGPVFLDQLMDALRLGQTSSPEIGGSAVRLAVETNAPISTDDSCTLNRCPDDAIAGAVTEFGRGQN